MTVNVSDLLGTDKIEPHTDYRPDKKVAFTDKNHVVGVDSIYFNPATAISNGYFVMGIYDDGKFVELESSIVVSGVGVDVTFCI